MSQAYADCVRRVRSQPDHYPVTPWMVPRRLRRDLAAVYAFARLGEELDAAAPVAERLERVTEWEEQLLACAAGAGHASHPVFVALASTIAAHGLPTEPFHDLLAALRREVQGETHVMGSFAELLEHCRRVANPIGRIMLGLVGQSDAERRARSDDVCTALQLTKLWQDVADDVARQRVAIPQDDLDRHPGSRDVLRTGKVNEGFRQLMAFEVERTRHFFLRGLPLGRLLPGRLGRELRVIVHGGLAVLARIERAGFDVFSARPALGRRDLAWLVLRELWR